jgi:ABC-type transport system involved in multi-copper enzyme maturation permease subunit
MRDFMEILRFELRLQCRSPIFVGLALLVFTIHLLTMAQVGIHISDNELLAYNSPHGIFLNELILNAFGLLPVMVFVVNAAVRDHALSTAEFFYSKPVPRLAFVLGRFSGGALCALLIGLAGLLGTLTGTFMPWLEANRVAAFAWQPYAVCFIALVAPNILVFCAFSFGVALLSRSTVLAFATAMSMVMLGLICNTLLVFFAPPWLEYLDPFGGVAIGEVSRFWSVAELNTLLPVAQLPANRLLWLGLGALALALTCWRFRLEFRPARAGSGSRREQPQAAPAVTTQQWRKSFEPRDTLAQLISQWRVDTRAVLLSPLFWITMALIVAGTIGEVKGHVAGIMHLPQYPTTGQMLGFFRFGLLQFVLIVIVFYSGLLIHREREHRLHEVLGASPYPDWVMLASKVLTLCLVLMLLLVASMLVSIGMQALAGQYRFELGVYLQGLLVNSGFYFCMLGVLACVLQTVMPGKWSGMALVATVVVALIALETSRFEHLLYGFRIPYVVYSDMNGFGHFLLPTYTLIAYWGVFCVLLAVAGHLLLPRGADTNFGARLRDAATRFTPALKVVTVAAGIAFALIGGWIYYNTNILNDYQTTDSRLQTRADYERRYASYKQLPAPAMTTMALEVDLYPQERRLISRGRVMLRNDQHEAIEKIVVSADPRLTLNSLEVQGGTSVLQDKAQGFYVFNLQRPLQPASAIEMTWTAARINRGFVNSGSDDRIVENGTFVDLLTLMPVPVYDEYRELTDSSERHKHGLPPAPRLPPLGDPTAMNSRGAGIDNRVTYSVVFSTDPDQLAVAPGKLKREWKHGGRRYFEYVMDTPVWPRVSFSSARYTVAHDRWNDIDLEVYYDAKHPWNVPIMLTTAKTALDYFSREFSPYPLSFFRIVEYPRYRKTAEAYPGTIPYSEDVGFLTNLSGWAPLDYATIHELAHHWWGGLASGARMQGRQILNETLAQYSTFMLFKQQKNPLWLRQILAATHDSYLDARSRESVAEQPVILTEDQGYISYNKAALAMFTLEELIGSDKMHQALRSYLDRFAMKPPPYPTSGDLVNELREVAGPEYQSLITDLFEKIMLYDVQMTAAAVKPVGDQFEVTMDITAQQFEADGIGHEAEVPLDTWFQVVVFPSSDEEQLAQTPLYQAFHRLHGGMQRLTVRVPKKPSAVGVDPFHLMIDKKPGNNIRELPR